MRSVAKERPRRLRRFSSLRAPQKLRERTPMFDTLRFYSNTVKCDLEFALIAAKRYIEFQHSFFGNRLTVPRSLAIAESRFPGDSVRRHLPSAVFGTAVFALGLERAGAPQHGAASSRAGGAHERTYERQQATT